MCLLLLAFDAHDDYPLVVAANRDEFHERPTAPAGWWSGRPVLAGRDLEAGGTWLGISRNRRFAAVTNFREPDAGEFTEHSRGELPLRALDADDEDALLRRLAGEGDRYSGYNLVFGSPARLCYFSNRGGSAAALPSGVHGLSNGLLNSPWPKVHQGKRRLTESLAAGARVGDLLEMLRDTTRPPDDKLPDTGIGLEWERLLAPMFVVGRRYGTRSSSVIMMRADGRVDFAERRYDRKGGVAGEMHESFG